MKSQTPAPHSSTNVLKAAGAMGIATLLSRLMGLVREQVFAILFGAGNLTDAFNVAFRIPNLLRDLFAEGAMSASLVPTFTQTRIQEGPERGWRVAGLVFRVLFVVVGVISLLGVIFAPQLVDLYASAYKLVPGKFELTVRMTRMMFPFFPLVALAAAYMGILNACGVFFLPAFASALFNITSVIVGVISVQIISYWGRGWGILPIEGMALGVVIGGAVQAFCQLPKLYQQGYRWQKADPTLAPVIPWQKDPRLKQMLWMMVPGTVGLAATQINILVNTILATSQGPGAVSCLNYAFRLMQFPIGVFGVSLAQATLPKVSQQWAMKDPQGVALTLTQSLRTVFAVNLPATAGLISIGYSIIQLIFEYGRFDHEGTRSTALALTMYALGLTAYSVVKVLVPACYALGNTRLPVVSSILSVLVTIGLNLMMVGPFGYWGLALGTSLAAVFNAAFLLGAIRRLLGQTGGQLSLKPIFLGFFQYLLVAAAMGGACKISETILIQFISESSFYLVLGRLGTVMARLIRVGILVTEGVGVLFLIALAFRLQEALQAFDLFTKKFKKRLRPKQT